MSDGGKCELKEEVGEEKEKEVDVFKIERLNFGKSVRRRGDYNKS